MKKTSRQPYSAPPAAISSPPTTGPRAVPKPTVRPSRPNARPRSARGNAFWMKPDTWGPITPPNRPCTTRTAISTPGEGASPRRRAGDDEAGDADDEHPAPPGRVAEPAADHGHQAEGEDVAADHPLELRRPGPGRASDRRQGDVRDADVEQGAELAHEHDAEGAPAAGVQLDGRSRSPGRPPAGPGGGAPAPSASLSRIRASPAGRAVRLPLRPPTLRRAAADGGAGGATRPRPHRPARSSVDCLTIGC